MVFLPLTLRQCSLGTEARRFEAGEIFAEKNYFLTEIKSVVRALSDFLKKSMESMANVYAKTENN